jgi:hypothetical protein
MSKSKMSKLKVQINVKTTKIKKRFY